MVAFTFATVRLIAFMALCAFLPLHLICICVCLCMWRCSPWRVAPCSALLEACLFDFFRAFAKRNNVNHWKEIKDYKSALDDLKGTGFFFTIPKFTPLTDQIWLLVTQTAAQNNMEWGICSSPLAGDEHNSAYWKRRWLEDTEMMPKVKNLVFTANKHKYAETYGDGGPSILIDDKPANIHR